jgi:hypothetical protein
MLGLTDYQLGTVMDMARSLPVEKRDVYLRRIAAMLTMRGHGHFGDADVTDVVRLASCGLAQQPA